MSQRFGSETRIIIGTDAGPQIERAAAFVENEVERRTGFTWTISRDIDAVAGNVVLGIPGDGSPAPPLRPEFPEEIALWCGGDGPRLTAYALAGGPSVALAAAGKLLRTMDLRPGVAALRRVSHREHPAFPVRGHHIANHRQNTTADKWEWGHWEEYLTDLAAWGMNLIMVNPLHPERWHGVLPFADPPWFEDAYHEAEFRRQDEIQRRLPALCQELGIRYGMWLPVNDIFPADVILHPHLTRFGGPYVCPHIPEARRRIAAVREQIFSRLSHIDMVMFPSRDNGGCPGCPDCTPWAETFLELLQEQAAQVRRHHPACTVWLTMQGLTPSEAQRIVDWLDRDRPDWVEGVAHGPFSELMAAGRSGRCPLDRALHLRRIRRWAGEPGASRRSRRVPARQSARPDAYVPLPAPGHRHGCGRPVCVGPRGRPGDAPARDDQAPPGVQSANRWLHSMLRRESR